MALRDELMQRIASLPEDTMEDVERYLDRVAGVSTAEYEAAYTRAVADMREGLLLHLDHGRLTREQLHERR